MDSYENWELDSAIVASRIQILEQIVSTLDIEEVLKRIVEIAVHLSDANEGTLLLLDEESGELYMRAAKGFGQEYASIFRQKVSGDSIAGQVMLTGEPILVSPSSPLQPIKIKTGYMASSVLNLPIKRGELIHGVLAVYNRGSQRTFTDRHLALLTPLANYAAIAIENARRYQETEELLADTYALFDISGLFAETHDLDELLDLAASLTLGRLDPADRVVIHLFSPETNRLECVVRIPPTDETSLQKSSSSGFTVGEGIAGRVLKERGPLNIPDIEAEERFVSRGFSTGSLLVAPISWRSSCIGTMSVGSPVKRAFTHRHERFLTSLANLAAIAIENARLYSRQIQLYQESQERLETVERRNRELKSLRDILGALQSTLSLPEVLGKVASGVVKGLNYKAVMLSVVDDTQQWLIVKEFFLDQKAATQNLLEQAEEIIQQKLLGCQTSLTEHTENIGAKVCQNRQPRVSTHLYDIFRPNIDSANSRMIQELFQLETFAVLPIHSGPQLFGVLYAGTERTEILAEDLAALQAFASQAALAIKNAHQMEHMHARLRRRMGELQSLQNIDRLLSSTADLQKMLRSILEAGLKLVDAEFGNITLTEESSDKLIPQVSYPEEIIISDSYDSYESGVIKWVAQKRKTARIQDLTQTSWKNIYHQVEVRSELAAPIIAGEELVGIISMASSKIGAFDEEDESLLDIMASQTAVAIRTAHYYQELEKSRRRFFEAERIAAMGDIASNMVHNINNSVGAIRVLVQQIRFKMSRGSLPPEFLEKKLSAIKSSAEKTLEMARNIRNPFQIETTELVDVNQAIKNVFQEMDRLPSTLDLVLNLDESLPPVMMTHQLEEVFRNVINNAIQSMKGLGTLRIVSRRIEQLIEVTVSDTGQGLSKDLTLTSVFNLGVSSKRDGLGYGLWWCKIYLNRMGGSIELDSTVKQGCRFLIKLPLEREADLTKKIHQGQR